MAELSDEIKKMQKGLIDFGLRNKLLYYNISRNGLQIINEAPKELFQILVLDRKEMEFSTLEDFEKNFQCDKPKINQKKVTSDDFDELPTYFIDDLLNTPYDKKELDSKLFRLYSDSNQILKNMGFSTLYIALGFIKWKSPSAQELNNAPLILIPLKIRKIKSTTKYRVSWTEEDITTNLPLQIKLEQESGVLIPNIKYSLGENGTNTPIPITKSFIDSYFENIKNVIKDQEGWEVIDDIFVDFFDFRKIGIYIDLNESNWKGDNLLACQTLGLTDYNTENFDSLSDSDLDEVIELKDTYPIMDADSSQLAIIEHAKRGESIIVEGPPGTGKSQTIANIIAELIGQQKSILFVSEKMAALEVVKNRLDNAGFGRFCLELHSEKTTQNSIYSQIRGSTIYETVENVIPLPELDDRARKAHVGQLLDYRGSLNSYAKEIREPIGDSDKNPIFFIGIKEKAMRKFDDSHVPFPNVQIKDIGPINAHQWREAKKYLQSLATLISKVTPFEENPWFGTTPDHMFQDEISQLKESLINSQSFIDEISKSVEIFKNKYGLSSNGRIFDVPKICEIVTTLSKIPISDTPNSIYNSISSYKDGESEEKTVRIISDFERVQDHYSNLIDDSIWDIPAGNILKDYESLITQLKEKFSQYSNQVEEISLQNSLDIFNFLETTLKLKRSLQEKSLTLSSYYKNYWHGEDSDPEELENLTTLYQEIIDNSSLFINIPDNVIQHAIWPEYIFGQNRNSNKLELVSLIDLLKSFKEKSQSLQFFSPDFLSSGEKINKDELLSIVRNHDYLVSLRENLKNIEERIDFHFINSNLDHISRINNLNLLEERNHLNGIIEENNIETALKNQEKETNWVSRTFKDNISISQVDLIKSDYVSLKQTYSSIRNSHVSIRSQIIQGYKNPNSINNEIFYSNIKTLGKYSQLKKYLHEKDVFNFVKKYERLKNKFNLLFSEQLLETNVNLLFEEYSTASMGLLKLFKYHSLKNQVDSYYASSEKRNDPDRLKDLKFACQYKNYIQQKSTLSRISKYSDYLSLKTKLLSTFNEEFIESDIDSLLSNFQRINTQLSEISDKITNHEKIVDSFYYSPITNSFESRINDIDRFINHNTILSDEKTKENHRVWRRYQEIQKIFNSTFHDSVNILEPSSLKEQYNLAYYQYQESRASQLDSISALINRDKKIIDVHYEACIIDLKVILQMHALSEEISSKEYYAKDLLGDTWQKERTDISELEKIISINNWIEEKYRIGVFNQNHVSLLKRGISISHIFQQSNTMVLSDLMDSIREIRELDKNKKSLEKNFHVSILEDNFSEEEEKVRVFISGVNPYLEQYLIKWNCKTVDSCIPSLKIVNQLQEIKESVISNLRENTVFSALNFKKIPNSILLSTYLDWCKNIQELSEGDRITEKTIEWVLSTKNQEEIINDSQILSHSYISLSTELSQIVKTLNPNTQNILSHPLLQELFSNIHSQLDMWRKNIDKLESWANYQIYKNNVLKSIAAPIIPFIENNSLNPELIVPLFEGSYSQMILNRVVRERPSLASFIVDIHELNIQKFKESDEKFFEINKQYLKNKIILQNYSQLKPHKMQDIRVIRDQLQKQRNRMSIRQLFENLSSSLTLLFPCVMMSPITVAQFVPNTLKFDVIIFDEASQIRPAESMGSILRGKQLIVIGDSQQLPPSDLFKGILADGNDGQGNNETPNVDMESILSLCTIKSSFPKKSLLWHYRSKHESLIAVSNKIFYDGRLVIFPSADFNSDTLGLFHLIPDAETYPDCYYVPKNCNRGEARFVADLVVEHFSTYGDKKSLGVATFNLRQKEAIEQELENIKVNKAPWIDEYLNSEKDLFFVKNLESIQGDERDVIIVSVGFGLQRDGSFHLLFGPVTQTGGERRLNVLFTRARERCIIVSNFSSSELEAKLSTSIVKNIGLNALKEYLHYAQYREFGNQIINPPLESPFEEAVYDFLCSEGYEVHTQVGCGRFRIDLAIVDPNKKSNHKYILGIECDGATYHSSRVARDRDRLRQIILEGDRKNNYGLGWTIHRIWSTDWWKHRDATKKRLIEAINAQL